jgi:hypothetical protein
MWRAGEEGGGGGGGRHWLVGVAARDRRPRTGARNLQMYLGVKMNLHIYSGVDALDFQNERLLSTDLLE